VRDKTVMYLRARPDAGDGTVGHDDLRNVVMAYLPADRKTPRHKPLESGCWTGRPAPDRPGASFFFAAVSFTSP